MPAFCFFSRRGVCACWCIIPKVLRCLDTLRDTMESELKRLSEPLAHEFLEDQLATRLSNDAVNAVVTMHPVLAKPGISQGDVMPFDIETFDFDAPWDNPEQVALHCILCHTDQCCKCVFVDLQC